MKRRLETPDSGKDDTSPTSDKDLRMQLLELVHEASASSHRKSSTQSEASKSGHVLEPHAHIELLPLPEMENLSHVLEEARDNRERLKEERQALVRKEMEDFEYHESRLHHLRIQCEEENKKLLEIRSEIFLEKEDMTRMRKQLDEGFELLRKEQREMEERKENDLLEMEREDRESRKKLEEEKKEIMANLRVQKQKLNERRDALDREFILMRKKVEKEKEENEREMELTMQEVRVEREKVEEERRLHDEFVKRSKEHWKMEMEKMEEEKDALKFQRRELREEKRELNLQKERLKMEIESEISCKLEELSQQKIALQKERESLEEERRNTEAIREAQQSEEEALEVLKMEVRKNQRLLRTQRRTIQGETHALRLAGKTVSKQVRELAWERRQRDLLQKLKRKSGENEQNKKNEPTASWLSRFGIFSVGAKDLGDTETDDLECIEKVGLS